jgi:class 3 adenylate cyclase
MFTDMVGSTEMTARLGDSAALELVRADDALVRRALEAYGGREIKHTGDGIMASFDSVGNSVRAAADIQRRFAAYNADASETLSVRIGIDAGIVVPPMQRCPPCWRNSASNSTGGWYRIAEWRRRHFIVGIPMSNRG